MTNTSEKPHADEALSASAGPIEHVSDALPKEEEIEPTLSAFFGNKKVRFAAFVSSVKKAKVSRFTQNDESNAWELMKTNDANGERLWIILSQPNLPESIERWVWQVAQSRLTAVIGPKFDPLNQTTAESLSVIREFIRSAAFVPDGRPDVNNWGRIGLRWLMEKRSVDAWEVADQLSRHLFRNLLDARKLASKALERGRSSELKQVVAMAAISRSMVENAQRERDTERRIALNLRDQLARSQEDNQNLQSKVSELHSQLTTKSAEIAKAFAQLDAERHHSGHDLTETKAAQQALLRERIAPLLSDAVDALEIDPPAPDVALRRLKNIIATIEKANQ